jgi:glycerophosphoryl diester phosphodiesterase
VAQQRLPSLLDPPVAFAHRGARAHARENTIEAFDLALKLGATGLESDVWVTADGVAVLDHDGVVRVRHRKRPIAELPRAALPAHMPALADLAERMSPGIHLSLDLKSTFAGSIAIETIREAAPGLLPTLWLCSPTWESLVPLRNLAEGVRLVDSTRLARLKEGPERRAATLASAGIDAVNLHHTDWNGGLVALFHRFGRFALGWDMQFERPLRDGLRMGLDGVFSDWVDRMMDAVRAEIGTGA